VLTVTGPALPVAKAVLKIPVEMSVLVRELLVEIAIRSAATLIAPDPPLALAACRTGVLSQAFWQTVPGLAETPDRWFLLRCPLGHGEGGLSTVRFVP
jgi:hypothetical protein